MPSFRRRDSVIDADRVEESTANPDRPTEAEQARALAEEAEAEAAEADAMAAAARARARAARLRREALSADVETKAGEPEPEAEAEAEAEVEDSTAVELGVDEIAEADESQEATQPRKRGISRLKPTKFGVTIIVTILAVLGAAALLTASGYMIVQHRNVEKLQQQSAEYSAAARQSVVTLMSLDFNNAEADVQRIIDNSTGQFKSDFETQAADFVKVAQDSKVVTEVTVNSTAVESMSPDKAEVLVAASSRVTNSAGANQEPRTWRLSVSLERENGQIKMSKVEFVP